ncbi:hypothetical protein CMI37_21400 [Candidatus Pacearchaeota archaeon]|nr:hypothetical protein [Candidatus Pacearchaeota archaeon]|tara:strand:- start:848 stop:1087 length:240 start_codon:yes stop_codon:yes gene_type:complete
MNVDYDAHRPARQILDDEVHAMLTSDPRYAEATEAQRDGMAAEAWTDIHRSLKHWRAQRKEARARRILCDAMQRIAALD